ncbi:MAG: glycosyltransferase family 2 protein [Syntrophobacteraceae bacterium]
MPFISFIVPMFNVERYVGECMESVLRQPFGDWEMILIDDCSMDGSAAIAAGYAAADSRITVMRNRENLGPGPLRNVGLTRASGEYLFFLDADDVINPDQLRHLHNAVQRAGHPEMMQVGYSS